MKLIVGLGNPDDKYKKTYHNLGFICVDKTAEKLGVTFNKQKCRALIAEARVGSEKIILAKPQTYMNLSGESVTELLSFYKIDIKDMIVIYDDYDLFEGEIRIRESGSAGTHNGMRNIIALIKDTSFPRIRVGFKPKEELQIPLIDYVLSKIKNEELFTAVTDRAGDCAYDFAIGKGTQYIMQKYNGAVK